MNNTMSENIKQILKDNLTSTYDDGNIDDCGIHGGNETVSILSSFIKKQIDLAVSEERSKLAKEIKEYYQNFFEVYDGKLPFSVLGQKATETEAMFFYQEGILQTIKMIEKDYPISSLKEGK